MHGFIKSDKREKLSNISEQCSMKDVFYDD